MLKGHTRSVTDISWCPHNPELIASASMDWTVQVQSLTPLINGHPTLLTSCIRQGVECPDRYTSSQLPTTHSQSICCKVREMHLFSFFFSAFCVDHPVACFNQDGTGLILDSSSAVLRIRLCTCGTICSCQRQPLQYWVGSMVANYSCMVYIDFPSLFFATRATPSQKTQQEEKH